MCEPSSSVMVYFLLTLERTAESAENNITLNEFRNYFLFFLQ